MTSLALLFASSAARAEDDAIARSRASRRGTSSALIENHQPRTSAEEKLAERLREAWGKSRALRRGTTAVYVADAVSGQVLFAVHEDRGLNPASNVKLVSTATALAQLGPDWRYRTVVYGTAPDANGVIEGDIYLLGSHDPTFHHTDIARLAGKLADAGVTEIRGSIRVGDDATRDTLAHPTVRISITGTEDGKPPQVAVTPRTPMVTVDATSARTHKRARRRARLRLSTQLQNADTSPVFHVRVSGRIRPGRTQSYSRKVPRPSTFTANVLRAAIIEAGIEIKGGVATGDVKPLLDDPANSFEELAVYESVPLRSLIARINKPSDNFLADRLIKTVGGLRYGGEPTMEKGVRAMREYLASIDIDPDNVTLDTGSGLSYKTSLSVRQIVRVLRDAGGFADVASVVNNGVMFASTALPAGDDDPTKILGERVEQRVCFLDSLAVAGEDGTLRSRFHRSPAEGDVIGKTGTLNSVIALSGFVSYGNDALAFAIVSNGHGRRRRRDVRNQHEVLTEIMHDYLEERAQLGDEPQEYEGAPPLCPPSYVLTPNSASALGAVSP